MEMFRLFSVLLLLSGAAAAGELAALLAFKSAIISSDPSLFSSWDPSASSPCSFSNVTCHPNSGEVTGISFIMSNLSGDPPFSVLCSSLPSLAVLQLRGNSLGPGADIAGLRGCTNLTVLDISFNRFSGVVPDLSTLSKLLVLNISDNSFSGDFPWSSLASMPMLQVLRAGDNPFTPTAAFPDVIGTLTNLQQIFLSVANIAGVIPPTIGRLTELNDLELADNFLHGEIPPEITKLTKLQQLELYNNSLTGELPAGFGNLKALTFFDASMNSLSGDISELRSLDKLVSLQLFMNNFSGPLPPEFGEFRHLVNLSLYNNGFSGELPAALGSWAEFNYIDVSTNNFSGPIPPAMCKQGTMTRLLMLQNNFNGTIPASYAACTTLQRFRVSSNSLTGEVPPALWGLPNAVIIDLAGNSLEGSISPTIAKATNLGALLLSGNRFSGGIPPEIGSASALAMLDMSKNSFSGPIPGSIGNLTVLESLSLQQNALSGSIPASLGSCSALTTMNLSSNRLTGGIPDSLGQLGRVNSIDLSNNFLSGVVPASFAGLKLSSLNLCNNQLNGPVPPALVVDVYAQSFLDNPGLCAMNAVSFLRRCVDGGGAGDKLEVILTCLLVSVAALLAVVGTLIYLRRRRCSTAAGASSNLFDKKGSWSIKSFRIVAFDEREIVAGVRDENLIGKGGSGNVYRVKLGTGMVVAVKHIVTAPAAASGTDTTTVMLGVSRSASKRSREFDAEVSTLSSIRHLNVVKLFCSITSDEGAASLLVYEHLPNGSLWDWLHGDAGRKHGALRWAARLNIALGAAQGLEYLHHGCHRPILHRDVKSSNILLDECFKPRIADFGLAKILTSGGELCSSAGVVAGTVGYMAPEYAYSWRVTEKSDVYSFGVVLLELVTGRMPVEAEYGEQKDIVEWVTANVVGGKEKVWALLDSRIEAAADREEAARVLRVAVQCTCRLPNMRPSMRAAVQMLLACAGAGEICVSAAKSLDAK